ncbi:hypothetical protein RSAG8_09702, partial [Rhizoctonia solani AG-8 WAC10335]
MNPSASMRQPIVCTGRISLVIWRR